VLSSPDDDPARDLNRSRHYRGRDRWRAGYGALRILPSHGGRREPLHLAFQCYNRRCANLPAEFRREYRSDWQKIPMRKAHQAVLELAGREVVITNPDKPFFPQADHTKLHLAASCDADSSRSASSEARGVGASSGRRCGDRFSRRTSLRAPSVLNSDYRPGFVQAAASLSSGALTRTKGAGRAVGREKGRKTVMPIRTRRFGPWALHCPKNGAVARPSDQGGNIAITPSPSLAGIITDLGTSAPLQPRSNDSALMRRTKWHSLPG
jgi:hypothetical protein